jgi:peptidyl-prolyl cis-trans isomerase C
MNCRVKSYTTKMAARTVLVIASASLAACTGAGKLPKSQVVANVNNGEITISQLNQALQTLSPPVVTPAIARSTVDSLIDEELLVQEALKGKLDRDPATMQAVEDARRQVLARAYAERLVWPKAPISLADAEKYYKANPLLFEQRKSFQLTIYTIPVAAMNDVLREDLDKTHSSDEVRGMLEKHDVKFETEEADVGSERIPTAELPTMSKVSVGDLITTNGQEGKVLLTSVDRIEAQPMSFERARSAIEDYLNTQRRRESMEAFLKQEKTVAKISYSAEFASNQPPSAVAAKSMN